MTTTSASSLIVIALAIGLANPQQTCATPSAPAEGSAIAVFRDCAECPEMVVIPAGEFTMGSPATEAGRDDKEGPQRRVRVSRFAAGKFHVTRGEWAAFAATKRNGEGDGKSKGDGAREVEGGCAWSALPVGEGKPWDLNPAASWKSLGFEQDDRHPVVCVSWKDASDYTEWLSKRTGHRYRLLSEAEWEYAARAGTSTAYHWGEKASHEYSNYGKDDCCAGLALGRDKWVQTSPVDAFPANPFGLHDMSGNVMTWTQDCLSFSYEGLPTDGSAYERIETLEHTGNFPKLKGAPSCSFRLLRGGDWGNPPKYIRAASRNFAPPPGGTLESYRSAGLGLRVARDY